MRTKEQLSNLRQALNQVFGPFVLYLNDEDIDNFANTLQNRIDNSVLMKQWDIRVRTEDKKELSWDDIEKEPNSPIYSVGAISKKCVELIFECPNILAIKITDANNPLIFHVIERKV